MAYQKGLVATLAELEEFYKGQKAGDVLELMNQTNDILTDEIEERRKQGRI